MTKQRAKQTLDWTLKILGALAALGVVGGLIAWGAAQQSIEYHAERLDGIEPRIGAVEREVSGLAAKQDSMHEDIREIKRFIIGARRDSP